MLKQKIGIGFALILRTRRQILEHLFKEGVMVVKKDYQACVVFIIRVSQAQFDSNDFETGKKDWRERSA